MLWHDVASDRDERARIQRRLEQETGTIFREARGRVALVYPSPYRVGMSSLGFQSIYGAIHAEPDRAAHRAFLPDPEAGDRPPLLTYEALAPISDYPVLAFSVAYELEIAGLIRCLELAGLPVRAEERGPKHPLVIAGGPLTFSNPLPLAPFVDAILLGEAEETIGPALERLLTAGSKREALEALVRDIPSAFVPTVHGDAMPGVGRTDDALLPAHSVIRTPNTELREMFLVEPERGCHRGCAYCVMRRSTNGGMRLVSAERVLSLIPEDATRVGLVGAAVTDHPEIVPLVEALVGRGLQVGISSLRADRLSDPLVAALRASGARTLTTAADGASQRLRDAVRLRTHEGVLVQAAELARRHGFERLKLYMIVGLPGEEEDDIEELITFATSLSKIVPLSLGVAPFVAKRNTPLDGAPFAGIRLVERRLERLRKGLRGRVEIRPTSARWAWVEFMLAQGGQEEGLAVQRALASGGRFADYRRAFEAMPESRRRRALVRPGERVGRPAAAPSPSSSQDPADPGQDGEPGGSLLGATPREGL